MVQRQVFSWLNVTWSCCCACFFLDDSQLFPKVINISTAYYISLSYNKRKLCLVFPKAQFILIIVVREILCKQGKRQELFYQPSGVVTIRGFINYNERLLWSVIYKFSSFQIYKWDVLHYRYTDHHKLNLVHKDIMPF